MTKDCDKCWNKLRQITTDHRKAATDNRVLEVYRVSEMFAEYTFSVFNSTILHKAEVIVTFNENEIVVAPSGLHEVELMFQNIMSDRGFISKRDRPNSIYVVFASLK